LTQINFVCNTAITQERKKILPDDMQINYEVSINREAYCEGRDSTDGENPHPPGTSEHRYWREGWNKTKENRNALKAA
jgi:hypothetical protein